MSLITLWILGSLLTVDTTSAYMSSTEFLAQAIENDGMLTEEDFAVPEAVMPKDEESAEEPVEQTEEVVQEPTAYETSEEDSSYYTFDGDIGEYDEGYIEPLEAIDPDEPPYTEVQLFRNGEEAGVMYIDSEGNIVDPNQPEEEIAEPEIIEEPEVIIEPEEEEEVIAPIEPLDPPEEEMKAAAPSMLERYGIMIVAGVGSVIMGGVFAMLFLKKKSPTMVADGSGYGVATDVESEKHDRMQAALAKMQNKG